MIAPKSENPVIGNRECGSKLRCADVATGQEFQRIEAFVAECRRQWPGAIIKLRPDGALVPPRRSNPATGTRSSTEMTDFEDHPDTPTEADLDACYGSKYLSATEVGDQKIRTKIARVRKQALPQQGGGMRTKFVLSCSTIDKEMVLNATNKTILVDALGRNPANWIGAEIGLFTEPTNMAGKPMRGLRLRVLNKPSGTAGTAPSPKPAPKPDEPWPDEAGDPGPEFDDE
jgi:hypothetical protein